MNKIIMFFAICTLCILMINCTKSTIKKETPNDSSAVETDQYAELNQRVRKAGNIKTPIELIKYYYGEIDADQDIEISVEQLEEDQYEIILIQENIKDDSIAGMKIIMIAKRDNDLWTVQDIQRAWKCWEGRGHSQYGTQPCI